MLLDVGLPGAISQICFHLFVCFARHQHGQALADSLKSNSSLVELYLPSNNIGDRGAEAPVLGAAGVGGMSDGFGSWTLLELWQRVIFKGLGVKFVCDPKESMRCGFRFNKVK